MELLPRITLPIGWNAQKDCEYFEERWDPVPSYTEALWRWMRFHHGFFIDTLDKSLRYVHERDARLVHIEPSCLSTVERIEILFEIAQTSALVSGYRSRLLEHLRACDFAENERRRVIQEHRVAGEHAWLYPVVELIDYIGDAAFVLDETMTCENGDYREQSLSAFDNDDQDCPPE